MEADDIVEKITHLKDKGDNELHEKSVKWIEKAKVKLNSLKEGQAEQQRRKKKEMQEEEKKIERWLLQEKQKELCLRQDKALQELSNELRVQLIWQEYQNHLLEKRGGKKKKPIEEQEVMERMREKLQRDEKEMQRLTTKKEKANVNKSFKEQDNEPKR